jgi:tetratricopeptide (TPR) repeat protein
MKNPDDNDVPLDATLGPSGAHAKMSGAFHFDENSVLAGRYKIRRIIARGGMGEVYEVEDLQLQEIVALKTLSTKLAQDELALTRFQGEVKSARRISHPNVCRVFEFGVHGEGVGKISFLTMELLSGETLDARMKRQKLSHAEILDIMAQVAAGLDAAHAMNVVHRDLKPSNILLVNFSGGGTRAVIADFGIARRTDSTTMTQDGWVGTPAYISPEQLEGKKVTHAADIYSMGIMLYEMVTGELPFKGTNGVEVAMQRLAKEAPKAGDKEKNLPPNWEDSIATCLKKSPLDRWSNASDALASMGALGVRTTSGKPRKFRKNSLLLASVLVALSALILAAVLTRSPLPAENRVVNVVVEMQPGTAPIAMPDGYPAFNEAVAYVIEKELTQLETERRFRVVRDSSGNTQVKISWKLDGEMVVADVEVGTKNKALQVSHVRAVNMQLVARELFPSVAKLIGEGQPPRELWPEEEVEARVVNAPSSEAYRELKHSLNYINETNLNDEVYKHDLLKGVMDKYPTWAHAAVLYGFFTHGFNESERAVFAKAKLVEIDQQRDLSGTTMLKALATNNSPGTAEMLRDPVATELGYLGRSPEELVALLTTFGKQWPDEFWLCFTIQNQLAKGQTGQAEKQLREWMHLSPGQRESWIQFARMNNSVPSIAYAQILFHTDASMRTILSLVALHSDDLVLAESLAKQMLAGPVRERAIGLYILGNVKVMQGQLHEAYDRFNRAWSLAEENPEIVFYWTQAARENSQIAEKLGNRDDSKRWRGRAIEKFKKYQWPNTVVAAMQYENESTKCPSIEPFIDALPEADRAEGKRFLARAAAQRGCGSCSEVTRVGRSRDTEKMRPWIGAYFFCAQDTDDIDEALTLSKEVSKLELSALTTSYDGSVYDAMMARYWTARLLERKGDKLAAKKAYTSFLTLWKNPDFKSAEWGDAKERLEALSK